MAEIAETRFCEICSESAFGPRFSSDNYASDGNVATLRTTDMRADGRIEYSSMPLAKLDLGPLRNHILRRGDLCITRTGRVGTTAVFEEFDLPVLPGAFLIRFRLNPAVADPLYYQYFFNSPLGQQRLLATASGSVQQNLNITALHEVQVPLPPLDEQREIAAVLASLDDKIEQNRRTGSRLEGLARAVFKAWFVDFEPVKAKAAGATAFPGMPPETFAALPTRFTNSPVGPAPEGWEQATLRKLAEFITGGTPSKKEQAYWGGDFPWVSAKDMHGRIVSYSELRLTDAGRDSVRRLAPRHSTLMVIRGMSLMTEVRIGWCTREVAFNQDIRGFIARDGIPPEFIHLWLTSSEEQLMQMVDTASHGTGRILTDRLDSMAIARPSDAVIQAFGEISRPVMALRETLHAESAKLASVRDYLLPRLLSGKVRVGEAIKKTVSGA